MDPGAAILGLGHRLAINVLPAILAVEIADLGVLVLKEYSMKISNSLREPTRADSQVSVAHQVSLLCQRRVLEAGDGVRVALKSIECRNAQHDVMAHTTANKANSVLSDD